MHPTDGAVPHELSTSRRWVVKIGSSLLTNNGAGIDHDRISDWAAQIARLRADGLEVVLVSSGAVAAGMTELGWQERPHELELLQAAAAVGQSRLVGHYQGCFQAHDIRSAQILLTNSDLADRQRYLNARSTLRALLGLGVLPIINENDTVVTDEIRFGDNDTLGALVANLVEADALVILTDQQGIFDADPRHNPEATVISEARANDPYLLTVASGGGALGRGGMVTKVRAARLAARSGALTLIAGGREEQVLTRLRQDERLGSRLLPDAEPLAARKQWLAGQLQSKGWIRVDPGAVRAIREQGKSLLPVGVTATDGEFRRGDVVDCLDQDGQLVARGLCNYSVEETRRILRRPSAEIESILGYISEPELVHRDNLVTV
ncbi:glutamate 5-kinase [Natronospirillum operosum]|uniref:Glutamate 5-kinase n=1 Tax=Natronospirillum operosum TaxID=2759953 RepID=A0A4Z0WD74_9GAMM|nr:glutamate 5-kinase [Natronospirillum operosum]TGG94980.1 glutamate 5-kinase [Natronospirillum operosum]